tara:strand:- start:92 stop:2761 length:2670 start_codon:yes stop_codon:yes gene_type:complete
MIKNFFIIIFTISCFAFSQNDGQPPLFINIPPIETFFNNSDIEIETQVSDLSPISKVILYYKFSNDQGYSSTIMEQDINYSANIPSDDISGSTLMYYFFAEDIYGNQSLYPDLGSETPLKVAINNSLDDNIYHDIETNLLAPIDKSEIDAVSIVVISLYNESGKINLDDIAIFIDNYDITSECIIDDNLITYIPTASYDSGEHFLSVVFNSKGVQYLKKTYSFFIKEKLEKNQYQSVNYIEKYNIKSSFSYDSNFDEYFDKDRPDNRPFDTHKINARLSFNINNYKFKVSSLFTGYVFDSKFQEEKLFKQPIDRLKFSIENKNLLLKYGDHSSDFSSLTLKGVRVRGFHLSYKINNFKTSFVTGNLKEPIQSYYNFNSDSTGWDPIILGYDTTFYNYDKGTPERELSALSLSYINNRISMRLNMLSAYDILSGIDIWNPMLYDRYELLGNAVAGIDFSVFTEDKKGWIKGESALSITNNLLDSTDIIIDTLNIDFNTLNNYEYLLGFPITNDAILGTAEGRGISIPFPSLDSNGNPIVDFDYIFNDVIMKGAHMISYKAPIKYKTNNIDFQGSYRHIPPNFVSFGSGSIQKDIKGFKNTIKMKLFSNQLSFDFGYDDEEDNLLGNLPTEKLKSVTTNTKSKNFAIGFNFNSMSKVEKLISYFTSLDNYKIENIPSLSYSIKSMDRIGEDVFLDSTVTSTTTLSHNITPSYKFKLDQIDFNLNANILIMDFTDYFSIDTASTNYTTESYSGGISIKLNPPIIIDLYNYKFDINTPLSMNIGLGYSNNIPDDINKEEMTFKLINAKLSYKFFEKKLSSFLGMSYVKGIKNEDKFSPRINNSKTTLKFGCQYKIWDKTSIGINIDYLIIDDFVNVINSHSELKGKIKFKIAL